MGRVIYAKYKEIEKKIIITCPECTQKLRLSLFKSKQLKIKCPKCNTEFKFDCKKFHIKRIAINSAIIFLLISFLVCLVVIPFMAIPKLNISIKKAESEYGKKISKIETDFNREIENLKSKYSKELKRLDNDEYRNKLREQASKHYEQIWFERENYNSRYALTPREKAQLEMLALAADRTKTIEEIVRSIAVKAAPKHSTVNVYSIVGGLRLDIDFDMSELTTGESGTRTKHTTIESLKKEVVRLISRVTNDVYTFCQDLDLARIAIGCRHYVGFEDKYSSSKKKNVILYKIRLDKKDIKELKDNPFLDIYSTTKYFNIEEDDFPNLRIERML